MPGPSIIEHGGKRILLQDFTGVANTADALRALADARAFVAALTAASEAPLRLLVLTDVEGSTFDASVLEALKEHAVQNRPHVVASAVVGLNPVKRVLVRSVALLSGRTFAAFETREQALDWLVRQ